MDNQGKMTEEFLIRPVARIQTDFPEKFGIPRQSGMIPELLGRIVFLPEYRRPEVLRELENFSHLWVIWGFTEAARETWSPTVRPPRLGGNRRVGVFASRSPFRPNHLGLSCLRLERVEYGAADSPTLLVSGVDLLDGTPIYDIKPYVPVSDCRPEASEGYTSETKTHLLKVEDPSSLLSSFPPDRQAALLGVLSHDPRPGYDDSPEKEYGMSFSGYDIGFRVDGNCLTVFRVRQQKYEKEK